MCMYEVTCAECPVAAALVLMGVVGCGVYGEACVLGVVGFEVGGLGGCRRQLWLRFVTAGLATAAMADTMPCWEQTAQVAAVLS